MDRRRRGRRKVGEGDRYAYKTRLSRSQVTYMARNWTCSMLSMALRPRRQRIMAMERSTMDMTTARSSSCVGMGVAGVARDFDLREEDEADGEGVVAEEDAADNARDGWG